MAICGESGQPVLPDTIPSIQKDVTPGLMLCEKDKIVNAGSITSSETRVAHIQVTGGEKSLTPDRGEARFTAKQSKQLTGPMLKRRRGEPKHSPSDKHVQQVEVASSSVQHYANVAPAAVLPQTTPNAKACGVQSKGDASPGSSGDAEMM